MSALKATFSVSSKASVWVNGIRHESGLIAHDFSQPILYQVITEDGLTATYTA
ncbi:hypothetical protein GXP67_09730 [Rhodocytophaga rosea]|uniref:Uncharacterized protein n=1 Tax=Rhodocytophaga rosea TaxID=2704465 RepID=A0A6C0GGB1_9BACT|nr:hypothetical protein [Rhodocytophaga rosea]QHT66915.1 hypothetical protein GXP67_09730 [Rhodocytophaga rosea]